MALGEEETQPWERSPQLPGGPSERLRRDTPPSFSGCKGGEGELHFQICKILLVSPYHEVEVALPEKLTCCVEELLVGGEVGERARSTKPSFPSFLFEPFFWGLGVPGRQSFATLCGKRHSRCGLFSRLAAIALLYLEQEDAFWCLVTIVEVFMPRDYYTKTLLGSQVCLGRGSGALARAGGQALWL